MIDIPNSIFKKSWNLLSKREKRHVGIVSLVQLSLSFLDLVAVAAMGVLGALAVTGIQSQLPTGKTLEVLESLHLTNLDFQSQVGIIAIFASGLLVFRTFMSAILSRRILFFLSRRGASITSNLIGGLLRLPLLAVQSKSTQELLYATTYGVNAISLGILAASISAVSDFSLLLIMGVGLASIDFFASSGMMLLFIGVAVLLYKIMKGTANRLGEMQSNLSIGSNEKILEVLTTFRENFVNRRMSFYETEISKLRFELANANAGMAFLPNISKYVLEIAMVLGGLLLSAIQFTRADAAHAVATLAVFLTAATRIVPAVLRLQQSAVQVRSSIGMAKPTFELIDSLDLTEASQSKEIYSDTPLGFYAGFDPTIEFISVDFRYPDSSEYLIRDFSLKISSGTHIAVVGPSGAGKTTLIDLMLGILTPTAGQVLISNLPPETSLSVWPGAISYVPQDVTVLNGDIKENVCLGFSTNLISDEIVWDALEIAQLKDVVSNLKSGLREHVGDRGTKLSGGQRQRLGIARALLSKPRLLVLDEATSALDGQSESDFTETLASLKGNVTRVTIAHRLSTVRDADLVVYMSPHENVTVGTFDEVRRSVPDFDQQAKLMGL